MTDPTDLHRFIQKAHELGAVEAKIIAPSSVVLAPWVRFKCQFSCPHYSRRLCCPPYTPTWEGTKKVIDCYEKALFFHTTGLDISPLDLAFELEQDAFFNGFYKALGFGAGPCWLCQKSNLEHCVHPLQARPSMEGCGIDVYANGTGARIPHRSGSGSIPNPKPLLPGFDRIEVRLAAVAQGAAYWRQSLDPRWYESGIPQGRR